MQTLREYEMRETAELEIHSPAWRGARDVERACIVLLDAELDIALGYLRIADAECSEAHAGELIAKATESYQIVVMDCRPFRWIWSKRDCLCASARDCFRMPFAQPYGADSKARSYIILARRTNS